jgi:hypothetical protein
MICLTPLLDDSTANGDSQIETITVALNRVNLTWNDILALEADNTAVNPSIARKMEILFKKYLFFAILMFTSIVGQTTYWMQKPYISSCR